MTRCPDCDQALVRVEGTVDPRTGRQVFTVQPCGDRIGVLQAAQLTGLGVSITARAVTGSSLIEAERDRQVVEEGYTPVTDTGHSGGELAWAAWALLDRAASGTHVEQAPPVWPFARDKWPQDKSALRLLIIAGALISAEIDRRLAGGETP